MDNNRLWRALFAMMLLGAFSVPSHAQTAGQDMDTATPQGKVVPPAFKAVPFSLEGDADRSANPVEFRAYEQMTEKDRLQASNAEGSIGETAGYEGLEFHVGRWNYQQIVCPALPKHIFLRFTRNNGLNDVSMFTASIPRGGEGKVRIIPIQRRGYSLFSPAPINALTVSAFNHIRAEENPDNAPVPDWEGTALCYAALAGGHPILGGPTDAPEKVKYPLAISASMDVPASGGAVITIPDVGADRPVEWKMDFDRHGKLLKAARTEAPLVQGYLYLHPASPFGKITQVNANPPREVVMPATPEPQGKIIVPTQDPVWKVISPESIPNLPAATPEPSTATPPNSPGTPSPQF